MSTVPPPELPDVTLHGNGLLLRPLGEDDVPGIVAACTDPLTQTWLPLPAPYTEDDARTFVTQLAPALRAEGGLVRGIEVDGRLAGAIDLKKADHRARTVEIGYWAAPWARGRGIMRRSLRLLAEWAIREQGFVRVEVRTATGNVASQRVAEAAGLTREGVLRQAGFVHAGQVDMVVWSLVASDLD